MVNKKSRPGLGPEARPALVMLAVILAINVLQAQARSSGPKVVVSEYRHDFGQVFAGQFMDHVFTIRNEGTSSLTLSDSVRHPANASVYSPVVRAGLANGLVQAGRFRLNAATRVTPSFLAAGAASNGPGTPAPT